MATGMNREAYDAPLRIDLDGILRARMSERMNKMLPRFATRALERIVYQDRLNLLLERSFPNAGSAFASALLRELNIKVQVSGEDNIPSSGRIIFVSNHPLGGLDGIALIKVLGERYGDENVKFLVNDLLMNVRPLRNVFLPINKYGSQGRKASEIIQQAYASDAQILIFPAGLVSRKQKHGIADLQWRKTFVTQALRHNRIVVPIFFDALNGKGFYNFAKWRERLGIKVNLEQALLPGELCKAHDKEFKIRFLPAITPDELRALGATDAERAAAVRGMLYGER